MEPTEMLAKKFHDTYESLSPAFGFECPSVLWDDVPEPNRSLMIAVCKEIMKDRRFFYVP
jgi:hypothetical protein